MIEHRHFDSRFIIRIQQGQMRLMSEQAKPSYTPTIHDMPTGEKPRERLRDNGPGSLSNGELIAILLRDGTRGENVLALSSRILSELDGLQGLSRTNLDEICQFHGIGPAKASQVIAALELGRRTASMVPEARPVITCADDIKNLVGAEMAALDQEQLRVFLLNNKHQVVGVDTIYQGTVNSASIRVSEILRPAIRRNCPAILVVHNHPSGDPTPSPEDILVTRRLNQSAEMMDIDLLDHIVVGHPDVVSMKSRHLGF